MELPHIGCDDQADFLLVALYSSSSISSTFLEYTPEITYGRGVRVPSKGNLELSGLRLNKTDAWQDFQGLKAYFS